MIVVPHELWESLAALARALPKGSGGNKHKAAVAEAVSSWRLAREKEGHTLPKILIEWRGKRVSIRFGAR